MKKLILILAIVLAQFAQAQSISKELKPFKAITVTSAMDVELIYADVFKIEVFGKDADKLKITNKKKELKLTTSLAKKFKSDLKVKVYYDKGLRSLKLANWVTITNKEPITEKFLEIEAKNNVKANLWIQTKDFIADLELGSNLLLKGITEGQKVKVSTKSFYDAFNFKSKKTAITVKAANAGVYVSQFLDATAKLKGEITYAGNPFSIAENTFLGKITAKKEPKE